MLEEGTLEQLLSSIGHDTWPVVIGYILLGVVALVRFLTADRFVGKAEAWVSAVSAIIFGIGAGLAAGGVWWKVLVIGVFGIGASSGLWKLVRKSIPIVGATLTIALLCTGCSSGAQVPVSDCTQAVFRCAADVATSCWPERAQNGDVDGDVDGVAEKHYVFHADQPRYVPPFIDEPPGIVDVDDDERQDE